MDGSYVKSCAVSGVINTVSFKRTHDILDTSCPSIVKVTHSSLAILHGDTFTLYTLVFSWKPIVLDVSIDHAATYRPEAAAGLTVPFVWPFCAFTKPRPQSPCRHVCVTTTCNWITCNLLNWVLVGSAGNAVGGELSHVSWRPISGQYKTCIDTLCTDHLSAAMTQWLAWCEVGTVGTQSYRTCETQGAVKGICGWWSEAK